MIITQIRVFKAIVILLSIGALLVLFLRFWDRPRPEEGMYTEVSIGKVSIPVTIADTEALRTQGLSNTAFLTEGTGKLFIFDEVGMYGFWMKDMRYAIDIIWIDENRTIVGVLDTITPDTYPTVFYPPVPVRYVLEVPAGFSKQYGIAEKQLLRLP